MRVKELKDKGFRYDYVNDKCKNLLGVVVDNKNIEFMHEGVLNFVYKVKTSKGIIYFKQALKKAKNHDRIGSDLASVHHLRIKYEKNVIDKIKNILPKEIQLQEILHYDEENNILITRDVAGESGELLQDVLLAGNFNEKTALNIGRFLGISHKNTYNGNNIIRDTLEEDRKNWELFLNMRTRGIAPKKIRKDVADELSRLFNETLNNHTHDVLINIDLCPKNIFQREDGSIGVFDFELASGMGDPAYDVGFALGHYFLFSLLNNVPETSVKAIKNIVNSYLDEIQSLKLKGIFGRMVKYAGAVLLYRVMGSSPANYIPQEKHQELIERGSELIICNCTDLDGVIKILKGA